MSLPPLVDWLFGLLGVGAVLWTLIKSVHIKVNVRVRKLTPEDRAEDQQPKFTFESQTKLEQGKPIRFGTRTGQPN
jgi:hypothetical protein